VLALGRGVAAVENNSVGRRADNTLYCSDSAAVFPP